MKCFRCNKTINHPDNTNADYVIASDTIANELVDYLEVLVETEATKDKKAKKKEKNEDGSLKYPDIGDVDESEYDRDEAPSYSDAKKKHGDNAFKLIAKADFRDIQKTGIVCPDCYLPSDFVIWGIHKE